MEETKKIRRIRKRRETLEVAAQEGNAFCEKHNGLIYPHEVHLHRCYNGDHGKNYCKYLRMGKK